MKKLFKRKVNLITDFDVTHVAMLPNGEFGMGGTSGKTETKWIDKSWWKKVKGWFKG